METPDLERVNSLVSLGSRRVSCPMETTKQVRDPPGSRQYRTVVSSSQIRGYSKKPPKISCVIVPQADRRSRTRPNEDVLGSETTRVLPGMPGTQHAGSLGSSQQMSVPHTCALTRSPHPHSKHPLLGPM